MDWARLPHARARPVPLRPAPSARRRGGPHRIMMQHCWGSMWDPSGVDPEAAPDWIPPRPPDRGRIAPRVPDRLREVARLNPSPPQSCASGVPWPQATSGGSML